jgi:hypothetical protein
MNLPFANPGGPGPDPVNGFGGAGGGFPLGPGTSSLLAIPPGTPPGAYKIRLIGLSPALAPLGRFADALTLRIGALPDGQPAFTAPAPGAALARNALVTFTWNGVPGAVRYLFEYEGGPDPGRLGGNLLVSGTSLPVVIPLTVPAGPYRVRVLGLDATGRPVGTFSADLKFSIP